ncbi:MAG: DUF5698 domain-containing protein [Candidatus Uhrbacteria bacterium]
MILFFVGIIEMIVISVWTHMVNKTRVIESGIVTVVNIFIWYYVLQSVVDNIENFNYVILYAFGCAIGTMITTAYFRYRYQSDQVAEQKALDLLK